AGSRPEHARHWYRTVTATPARLDAATARQRGASVAHCGTAKLVQAASLRADGTGALMGIRSSRSAVRWLLIGLAPALCAVGEPGTTTVTAGNARFEFLTPSLLRMEYSSSEAFTDASTVVVQKRDWPPVPIEQREQNGWLIAASSAMTLRYRLQSGAFNAANLKVTWNDQQGGAHEWHPGQADPLNLGGLTYSLDNVSAANLPKDGMDLESPVNDEIPGIDLVLGRAQPGLLSRSGFAFIDDSPTPIFNVQRSWIEPRPQPLGQDWYLFTYGHDYARVLAEYAELCGGIPMIPRYVLGAWITDFNFEYFPGTPQSQQPG